MGQIGQNGRNPGFILRTLRDKGDKSLQGFVPCPVSRLGLAFLRRRKKEAIPDVARAGLHVTAASAPSPGLRFFLAAGVCGRQRRERTLAAGRKSGFAPGAHPQSRRAESTKNMGFSARSRRANQVRTFGAQVRTPAADGHGRCALTRS